MVLPFGACERNDDWGGIPQLLHHQAAHCHKKQHHGNTASIERRGNLAAPPTTQNKRLNDQ